MKESIERNNSKPTVYDQFDVIVVGAGLSGVAAAVTAGRRGAKTILLERSGILGGVATASLMSSSTNFFFNTKEQIIKGFPQELFENLVQINGTSISWKNPEVPQIPYDSEKMQLVLYKMLKNAGVKVLLYSLVTDVLTDNIPTIDQRKSLKGIIIENKSGRQEIFGKVMIDCSGDADLVAYAGGKYDYSGIDGSTVMFEMGGVNIDKLYQYYKDNQDDFDTEADFSKSFSEFEKNWLDNGIFHTPHNGGEKNRLLQQAIETGDYMKETGMAKKLDAFGLYGRKGTDRLLVNSNYFYIDPLGNIEELSSAKLEGVECCIKLGELLKKIMPGFENSFITQIANDIGIRVTRIVQCEYKITDEDFLTCKKFNDAFCFTPSMTRIGRGVKITDKSFGIPYRSVIVEGLDNVLIGSGKNIYADNMVIRKSLRAQINTMNIGESVGKVASVAALKGVNIRNVSLA